MPYPIKGECRNTGKTRFKKGQTSPRKGKIGKKCPNRKRPPPFTIEHCMKMGNARKGEKNYNWKGGISKKEHKERLVEKLAGRKRPELCESCCSKGTICFDHDHKTGLFRGWLCKQCNFVLGLVHDDIKILKSLIDYLNKND